MRDFLRSFLYAGEGVAHVLRTQRNARVHLLAAMLVAAAGLALRVTAVEWAILALAVGLVLTAEMFNSVTEASVDLVVQEYHPLAKVAKDAGAGAVLVAAVAAIGVAAAIFGPRLWAVLTQTVSK
jgi:diacylglycerol kinase